MSLSSSRGGGLGALPFFPAGDCTMLEWSTHAGSHILEKSHCGSGELSRISGQPACRTPDTILRDRRTGGQCLCGAAGKPRSRSGCRRRSTCRGHQTLSRAVSSRDDSSHHQCLSPGLPATRSDSNRPRYSGFPQRASPRPVLGLTLPVASLSEVLQGKLWAAIEPDRRPTKRKKDLLDIERLLEAHPELRAQVPGEILSRLE